MRSRFPVALCTGGQLLKPADASGVKRKVCAYLYDVGICRFNVAAEWCLALNRLFHSTSTPVSRSLSDCFLRRGARRSGFRRIATSGRSARFQTTIQVRFPLWARHVPLTLCDRRKVTGVSRRGTTPGR